MHQAGPMSPRGYKVQVGLSIPCGAYMRQWGLGHGPAGAAVSTSLLGSSPRKQLARSLRSSLCSRRSFRSRRHRLPWYSRGIRQKLWKLTRDLEWDKKYNVRVDGYDDHAPEAYSWCVARFYQGFVAFAHVPSL